MTPTGFEPVRFRRRFRQVFGHSPKLLKSSPLDHSGTASTENEKGFTPYLL